VLFWNLQGGTETVKRLSGCLYFRSVIEIKTYTTCSRSDTHSTAPLSNGYTGNCTRWVLPVCNTVFNTRKLCLSYAGYPCGFHSVFRINITTFSLHLQESDARKNDTVCSAGHKNRSCKYFAGYLCPLMRVKFHTLWTSTLVAYGIEFQVSFNLPVTKIIIITIIIIIIIRFMSWKQILYVEITSTHSGHPH
jgi:hypothetical protein